MSSSIYRLKKTKEGISNKLRSKMDLLIKQTSSEFNFKMLRQKIHAANPPLIPFPGIYQGDLVFLDSGSKTKIGDMINFQKCLKMTGYIVELQIYQQSQYALEAVYEIQEYIKNYYAMSEDDAYSLSLQLEPRAQ